MTNSRGPGAEEGYHWAPGVEGVADEGTTKVLRDKCRENNILFAVLGETFASVELTPSKSKNMLLDFQSYSEAPNLTAVLEEVDSILLQSERD